MMPATNQGVGANFGFPDVCNTVVGPATAPIPYPNFGMDSLAVPFSPNVFVSGLPGHNQTSSPVITNGDEAGCVHSSFIGTGGSTFGNPTIHTSGMPSEHLCTLSQGNRYNCPLDAKLIPSITNVFYAFRAESLLELATGRSAGPGVSLDSSARVTHLRSAAKASGLRRGDLFLGRERERVFVEREGRALELTLRPLPDLELAWEGSEATLTLRRFLPSLAGPLERALERARGASRLTLDLRANPGGDLALALELAARFVPAGRTMLGLESQGRRGLLRRGPGPAWEVPLRVRVDADTASAGEALCLALRGRATFEGGPTYGKRRGVVLRRVQGGLSPQAFAFA